MPTILDLNLDQLCINSIRTLAIDAVEKANSGHPGLPLGAAPMAYALFANHLRFDPTASKWPDRDRFVLSAGHGSMLLYALLHLFGYKVSLADLKAFRQWGSITPGHPEFGLTDGVEATTGPLGQGTANAVGMAIAERMLAHRFNRPGHAIVDHLTYALVSDGDLMEGISGEAASLAGHLRLGKLTYLYDSNHVCLDGPTSMTFSDDVGRRYEAYGWHVQHVRDGNTDLAGLDRAIDAARKDTSRPSIIVVTTTIGFGSPNKGGTSHAHGSPLGEPEVALTKKALGWDPEKKFFVPEEARQRFAEIAAKGTASREDWDRRHAAWAKAFPDLAQEWDRTLKGNLPSGFDSELPSFAPGTSIATRAAGGKVLNALAARIPELVGGDADLSVSTMTGLEKDSPFDGQTGAGRRLHFGVREHAMGAIVNGICYHGGLRPFAATFFCFSDYMRPAVRLAALSELAPIFVWTHDSIGLGEDGPTHQPVEHLMALRAMPNLWVIRPGDAVETVEAWKMALERRHGPTAIVLSRQALPVFERKGLSASLVHKGAYILEEASGGRPEVILIATGSEVSLAAAARAALEKDSIPTRLVSMPCFAAFAAEKSDYREMVLPSSVRARVSVEAGVTMGWERFIGEKGVAVGLDRFGASAPASVSYKYLGLTVERIVEVVRKVMDANAVGEAADRPRSKERS